MGTLLMVGTRKGMWLATSDDDRKTWEVSGPHFDMQEVYSCLVDTRGGSPRIFAGSASSWFGPAVYWSDDLGGSWRETRIAFDEDVEASVEGVWQLVPGVGDTTLWAGSQPAAVWRSEDRGQSFTLERALWDHPHRPQWDAGFGGQAFHTIVPHPTDAMSVTVALSTGGVYQTNDGGQSWEPRNQGVRVEFFPENISYPEFGQCVHKVARHPAVPERMYLQNHGGVYRTDDHGKSWTSIADGLPADFGFPIVVHPHRPETVFVFPLLGADRRYPPAARARVWRSDDAGAHWSELGEGLPDSFYVGVMRDAFSADDHDVSGFYLGARNGTVYCSTDDGESWREVLDNLPDVMVVRAARI